MISTTPSAPEPRRDEGSTLILVLVLMVIGTLVVLPMMDYAMSVFRAQNVQIDKQRSVQAAQGGTWVALGNQSDLWDLCNGSTLPSSLTGVTTTCQVLDVTAQYPPESVPHSLGVVQADATLPGPLAAASGAYVNPNTTSPDPADYDKWLDAPDWSPTNELDKVWLPKLPVRAVTSAVNRDQRMPAGTQETGFASCRVFFPGTFNSAISISEPTYFISGVYYFTEPITITNGAHVVVGSGAAGGCTTDFDAIGNISPQPTPINFSGIGGTFVLGEDARIIIDDSGSGSITFAMNQRFVEEGDVTTIASKGVSIVSVNGTHAPLVVPEVPGDDLVVDGVISVPASVVGTDGDPLAVSQGYSPSVLTPKPTQPDAPTNVTAVPYRTGTGTWSGAATISWDIPNDNGSLITGYMVTADLDGLSCAPSTPLLPATTVQPSCTITGMRHNRNYIFSVVATNGVGVSPAASTPASIRARTTTAPLSPPLAVPSAPLNPAVGVSYSDGLEITWDAPLTDGGSPITHYHVYATETLTSTVDTCDARWDETSCVLTGLTPGLSYRIEVEAVSEYLAAERFGPRATIDGDPLDDPLDPLGVEPDPVLYTPGSDPAPIKVPAVAASRVPEPIIDVRMNTSNVSFTVAGYVSVPQGHIRIDASAPANKTVALTGGVVAAQIRMDAGREPAALKVWFDNPVGQKVIRLRSSANFGYQAVSDAVIQLNRSGSLKVNSWHKQ